MATSLRPFVVTVLLTAVLLVGAGTSWASSWVVKVAPGGSGEATALGAPAAPSGVAAACTSSTMKTVNVTWSAVTHATSYSLYQSTTSASGTYSVAASGVAGTSWTSSKLASGNYWFEVAAFVGTNWLSVKSSATGESTISGSGCVQP